MLLAAVIGRQRGKHLFVIQMSLRRNMILVVRARTEVPVEPSIPAKAANAVQAPRGPAPMWHGAAATAAAAAKVRLAVARGATGA